MAVEGFMVNNMNISKLAQVNQAGYFRPLFIYAPMEIFWVKLM